MLLSPVFSAAGQTQEVKSAEITAVISLSKPSILDCLNATSLSVWLFEQTDVWKNQDPAA